MTKLSWIEKKVALHNLYASARSLRAKYRFQRRKQLAIAMEHAAAPDGIDHRVAAHHQLGVMIGACAPATR